MNIANVSPFRAPAQSGSRAYNYVVLKIRDAERNDRTVVRIDMSISAHSRIISTFRDENPGSNVEVLGGGQFTVRPEGALCVFLFPSWPQIGRDPQPEETAAYLRHVIPELEVTVVG